MTKGATAVCAIVLVATGGYFAYDYFNSKSTAKSQPSASTRKTTAGSGSGSQPGSGSADVAVGSGSAGSGSAGSGSAGSGSAGPGSAGSGSAGSGSEAEPVMHKVHELALPDLTRKTLEQARAELLRLGFKDEILEVPPDYACTYQDERNPVPVGTICNMEREPGTKVMSNAKVRVVVEHDTWERGGVKAGKEWRRMPNLVGMPLARARQVLRDKGFRDDEFTTSEARDDCGAGVVCEHRPKADGRKYADEVGELGIGN